MIEFYVSNEFKYLMSLNQHVLEKSMNLSFIPFPSYAFLFPPPTKPITIQTNSTKLSINSFFLFYFIFILYLYGNGNHDKFFVNKNGKKRKMKLNMF